MREIKDATEMSFIDITEAFPDECILAVITKMDYERGGHRAIPIFAASKRDDIYLFKKEKGIDARTIIIEGINLHPVLGGYIL